MIYKNIVQGKFLSRPNRFIAQVEIQGEEHTVHVKNTGRCKELLTDNATVFLEKSDNQQRKTQYDLIGVIKGNRMINMDSQAPNIAFKEYLQQGLFIENINVLRPEYKFSNSRIDFYVESQKRKILIEIKGVTLEDNNKVYFPDAPTQRGVKHINELISATKEGYEAYIVFVVQMEGVKSFSPNYTTQPEFGYALEEAQKQGVKILAFDCKVTENSMVVKEEVPVKLGEY